jgi:hypothetical protein
MKKSKGNKDYINAALTFYRCHVKTPFLPRFYQIPVSMIKTYKINPNMGNNFHHSLSTLNQHQKQA